MPVKATKKTSGPPGSRVDVRTCRCVHDAQDEIYGRGKRVFNRAINKNGTYWRCTVCEAEQQ